MSAPELSVALASPLIGVVHLAPIATGSTLAPMAAAFFAASLIAPRLVTRLGRKVVTYGIALQGAGLVVVAATVLAAWARPSCYPAFSCSVSGKGSR